MPPAASGASVKRSYTDAHKDSDKCRIDHRNSWTTHKTLANEGIWTLYVEVDICTSSHTGRPVTSATRRVTRPTTPSQLLHGPLQRKLASIYVYYRAPIKSCPSKFPSSRSSVHKLKRHLTSPDVRPTGHFVEQTPFPGHDLGTFSKLQCFNRSTAMTRRPEGARCYITC